MATSVIHVISFGVLQDDRMAVIGKKNKAQLGNSQISVVQYNVDRQCMVTHHTLKVYLIVLVFFSPSQCHLLILMKNILTWYLSMAFVVGVQMQQEQNTTENHSKRRCP